MTGFTAWLTPPGDNVLRSATKNRHCPGSTRSLQEPSFIDTVNFNEHGLHVKFHIKIVDSHLNC